jgi:methionyl-tRNA formyltransferase
MKNLRIVFMGTPEFAVPSLDILVNNGFDVVAVVTAPDKAQGRGQQLQMSAVKQAALRHGLQILQPVNLKSPEFLNELRSVQANLQIVVAFRMLPESVWSMPAYGTFNLHASLLPQYRGAAPINWAVINGEKETGVTTFFLQQEIDTGSILFQDREPISPDDTAGSLYDRLMTKGAALVLKTTQAIANDSARALPQTEFAELKRAPKIFRETCEINWAQSSEQVRNFVRGLNPYPSAWTAINGKVFKVHSVTVDNKSTGRHGAPGAFDSDNKSYICAATADGGIRIDELQAEGKRKMKVEDFLKGNKLT